MVVKLSDRVDLQGKLSPGDETTHPGIAKNINNMLFDLRADVYQP